MTNNRMVISLMEEYKLSAIDLNGILAEMNDFEFTKIRDQNATDPDCKSIQTIIHHVIKAGYTYVNYINTRSEIEWKEYEKDILTPSMGILEIDKMLNYTEKSFKHILHYSNDEIETWKFESRWGVVYDFEQLMEHAIVHFLRHRRQIQNFLND